MPPAMTQISDPKIAFAYLRPACVLLTRQPTVDNVERLHSQLKEVDDATLQQLQDYILFPLRFVLRTPGSKEKNALVQVTVEAMSRVLERTCVPSWETLRELMSELCMCVCSRTDVGKPACTSEELKLSVLRCLDALLHAAYGDIFFKLFEPAMLPGLGAAVSLLLSLAEKEKCREIQTAALKCLLILTLKCDCGQDHLVASSEERRAVGGTMASFLPGVTTTMTRMITGDLRQGHLVTVGAMKVWTSSVGLVLEDVQLQTSDAHQAPPADLGRIGQLVVQRSVGWVKSTAEKLSVLLKKIISCTSAHRHWRVRLQTVELADALLRRCQRSLGQCVGLLLEALVGAVNDEESRVKERCQAALKDVSERNQASSDSQSFTDVLSENLHTLCTSLPRLMRTSDDQKKLFVLNVFLGYLKLLGPLVSMVLNSAAHLERISKALMQVLELDVKDVRIVEERNLATAIEAGTSDFSFAHTQRKHFLLFTDDKIFSLLMEICRTLGYHGNIYLLSDHFLDLYRQSQSYRKQAAMVLNQLVRGAAGHSAGVGPSTSLEDLTAVVHMVLDEYMSVDNWQLLTTAQEREKDPQDQQPHSSVRLLSISDSGAGPLQVLPSSTSSCSVLQLNSNIWQLCLQLEGVSCCAQALGVDFRPLLMTSLYPVLEKAGEETLLVSQAALSCLWDVARSCRYQTLTEMINLNCDYLLNDVSLNLQRLSQHPEAPRVLTVMLVHSDRRLLPLVGDIVQDVLTALDLSYERTAPLFCCVLLALMKALARWFPSAPCPAPSSAPPPPTPLDHFDVQQFLLEYQKQKDLAEGRWVEGVDDQDVEAPPPSELPHDDDDDGDKKGELPLHLSVTKDVMERCVHLLSDPDLRVRLKVLDVLELCVCLLSEKEEELLPMVHRCWPALLQRLTADDPLAILRAFRVLCSLGDACGDFLRRRVSKEILPKVSSSLLHQAPVSARAGPVYTHTLAYKLQLAVLQGLGSLCQRLDLGELELEQVCETCLPYLSCRQPAGLQEACLSVFRILARLDPDLVWFILNELHCPTSYEPPHPDLLPVLLSGAGRPRDEFSDNVVKLLSEELS
ncbi:TELO2-interacting protein 1 homolog [Synchiropus picturatus]